METYHGHVRSPQDAIILFEACRLGLLPRVQRRLSEKERQQINSGSVFVWDEREAGMRRWTDGKSWSASRVSGSFLTYREMEGKRGGTDFQAPPTPAAPKISNGAKSPDSSRNEDSDEEGPGGGYRYKPDGLMKQSFSITTQDSRHLHLISYYARNQQEPLKHPSSDPVLRNIQPAKGMYPEAAVNEPSALPPVTRGPMASTSPYPSPAPPQQLVVAYPYPPPGYHHGPIPIQHGYPPPHSWPGSPAPGQPPTHIYYAHPGPPPPGQQYHYAPAPYHYPQYPPYPYHHAGPPPGIHDQRVSHLPSPLVLNGAHGLGSASQPSPRPFPSYSQNGHHHSSPYGSAPPESRLEATSQAPIPGPQLAPVSQASLQLAPVSQPGPQLAPVSNPTPPPSSHVTPVATKNHPVEPAPIREVPKSNGDTTPTKIIPSINSLINGDTHDGAPDPRGGQNDSRSGSKSPASSRPGIRDLPNAMVAGGLQRDKNDLKRLDSQLLKS